MKCIFCGSEWKVNPSISSSLQNCPFCGKSLVQSATGRADTLEDVLREITSRFGLEILKNGQKTVAVFSDLSPQLKRERLLLSYLFQSNGNLKLLDALSKDAGEQQACFRQVYRYLVDEQFVTPEAAERICVCFSSVIGLTVKPEKARPAKQSEPVPSPLPKSWIPAVTPAQTAKPARSPSVSPAPPKPSAHAAASGYAAAPGRSAALSQIDTYYKYQKALEDYYIRLGRNPLTEDQIRRFLGMYSLDRVWGITVADVQKDLLGVYAKYDPAAFRKTPVVTPMSRSKNQTSQRIKSISTYDEYMEELERRFLNNNKQWLTRVQIEAFLDTYDLRKNFNISVADVKTDLAQIMMKY